MSSTGGAPPNHVRANRWMRCAASAAVIGTNMPTDPPTCRRPGVREPAPCGPRPARRVQALSWSTTNRRQSGGARGSLTRLVDRSKKGSMIHVLSGRWNHIGRRCFRREHLRQHDDSAIADRVSHGKITARTTPLRAEKLCIARVRLLVTSAGHYTNAVTLRQSPPRILRILFRWNHVEGKIEHAVAWLTCLRQLTIRDVRQGRRLRLIPPPCCRSDLVRGNSLTKQSIDMETGQHFRTSATQRRYKLGQKGRKPFPRHKNAHLDATLTSAPV